jgi:formate hydrogenlyase transcriptional activator
VVSMQLVAFSRSETAVDDGLGFERLLTSLSTRLASLEPAQLVPALDYALEQVCLALKADRSTIIEFDDQGTIRMSHSRQRPGLQDPPLDAEPASWRWLTRRLLNREVVTVSSIEELPIEALAEREYARRSGLSSTLAVAVGIGDRSACALVVGSFRRAGKWPAPALDRARLLAGNIGSAVQLSRQQAAARATIAEIAKVERRRGQVENENDYLRREVMTLQGSSLIVGGSKALQHALDQARQVAPTVATVLLLGETGTGKELFASLIHDLSPRRNRPMIRVNCSAIPPALIESELFGREKGAYTGALSQQAGRFEVADKSTLFLDEIGDLPLEIQVKLLRVLQERQIERLGSSKPINVDVRIVAATNRDLEKAIAQGTFREDLYYRLNVFPIRVPPLRERPDDIPMLIWSFVDEFSRSFSKPIESVSKENILALRHYPWPGNIRELRNVVERAVIVATRPHLTIDLPRPPAAVSPGRAGDALADVERDHIVAVLERVRWRVRGAGGAADLLRMKPSTLESRMAKLKIQRPRN